MTGSNPQSVARRSSGNAVAQAVPDKWPAPIGRPPSIENRHPSELEVDDSYQRSTDTKRSQSLIRKIASNWDWRMCLPLVVSRRDDAFYVIDGQHRLAAARLRGDIPFLPCCITTYNTVADEAAMFVAMNRTRKAIGVLDDFHAAVAGNDPDVLAVCKLVEDAGFTVARTSGSVAWPVGAVAFTTSIKKVRKKHGSEICAEALNAMAEAFPDEVLNAGASTFLALCDIALAGSAPDRDRLIKALRTKNQKGWASLVVGVKGGGEDRARAVRQMVLMMYDDLAKAAEA